MTLRLDKITYWFVGMKNAYESFNKWVYESSRTRDISIDDDYDMRELHYKSGKLKKDMDEVQKILDRMDERMSERIKNK